MELSPEVLAWMARLNGNKNLGPGTVVRAVDMVIPKRFTSGSLGIDVALGGGWPGNQWIEVLGPESSGKSAITLKTVAANQRLDKDFTTFWLAAEHYDTDQAAALGVDNDRVVVAPTQKMEIGLDLLLDALESKIYDCLVLDSFPALLPDLEEEKGMDEATVAVGAKLFNKFWRKAGDAGHRDPYGTERPFLGIVVNQFRDKIGGFAKFGCLHASTLVNFVDGRSVRIKDVVDQKLTGEVWAFNEDTTRFEPRAILGWAFNGLVDGPEDYLHITANGVGSKNGRYGITVTPEHEVLTPDGWIEAQKIQVGDELVSRGESVVNGTLADFLRGTLVGDSHLTKTSANAAALRLQDSSDPDYLAWKIGKLSAAFTFTRLDTSVGIRFTSGPSNELMRIKEGLGKRDPSYLLDRFTPLGLAVWIMDDAHYNTANSHRRYELSVKRLSLDDACDIAVYLGDLGFEVSSVRQDRSIVFTVHGSRRIADAIAEFVPPCMQRKLPESHWGRYRDFSLSFERQIIPVSSKVLSVRLASARQMKNRGKYDLAIEGSHNYLAGGTGNGVVVHNTPQTSPGGHGKDYAFYTRLKVARDEFIEEKRPGLPDPVVVGQTIAVKTIKNKSAAPQQTAKIDLYTRSAPFIGFSRGDYDLGKEYVSMGVLFGVIQLKGSWCHFAGDKWISKDAMAEALREGKGLAEKLAAEVLEVASDPRRIDDLARERAVTADSGTTRRKR
jgi:RecA/RadA recombinase